MSGEFFRLFSSTIFLVSLGAASGFADIPSNIDVSKYQEIHDQKKSSYEDSRGAANKKHSDYATRIRERENLQAEHRRLQAQIDRNEATIQNIEENIEASTAEQLKLRARINDAETTYKKLQAEITGLDASIRTARSRLTTQDNTVAIASQNKLTVESELRDARDAYNEASTSLSDSKKWLGEVQREQQNLARQLRELEGQLTTQRSQKTALDNESNLLADRADKLQSAAQKQQAEIDRVADVVDKAERAQKRAETQLSQINNQLAHVSQELSTAQATVQEKRKTLRQAENAVGAADKALNEARAATARLDVEKEELETKVAALMPEIQRTQQELERIGNQIENVLEQLKTAEGDKKTQLETRLSNLRARETETQKELQEKRGEMQQARRRLLAIPAEKAERRREELSAERTLAQAKDSVVTAQSEVEVARTTVESLVNTERELRVDLAVATQVSQTAAATLREARQQMDGVKSVLKTIRDEQQQNQNRQREVAQQIRSLTQSINTLENDSIPSLERAQARNDAEVERFSADVRKYDNAKNEKQRLVSRLQVQLQNTQDILQRELNTRQTISDELDRYVSRQGEATAESAAIVASNRKLEQSIDEIENQQVTPAKARVREITRSNEDLRTARDTTQKNIDGAIQIELFAKAAYESADEQANTLQAEWQSAASELATVKSNYQLGLGRAVADGSAAGKASGAKEALERALGQGTAAGQNEGNFDGTLEGGKELKQEIFDEAVERSYRVSYEQTKREKTLESAAEKDLRLSRPELQARFVAGEKSGKDKGYADGLKEGDNATQEAAGTAEGVADGKAEAERMAEQTHKPMGKKSREDEILASEPKETLEKDLLEGSAQISGLLETGDRILSVLSSVAMRLLDSAIPSARADRNKGVLQPSEVPAPTYQYPAGATQYPHPDYDKAYAEAYRAAYLKFYVTEYISVYKRGFDTAYDTAYGVAFKEASDPDKHDYPEVKARGEAKGTELGRFEGLGYNAAYAQFKAKGVKDGEATAFARGYNAAKEPARKAHLPVAQKNAYEAGRLEVDRYYRNHAVVNLVGEDKTALLLEADGDGKFSFGEKVSLSVRVRNFGGVDAEDGSVSLRIDRASVSGITLENAEIPLGVIEQNTEVLFKNVLTGKIGPGARVAFAGNLIQNGKSVGDFDVKEEVFSPFTIKFTYEYDLSKGLVVPSTDGQTGAFNFVWIHTENQKALDDLDSVQITPVDRTLVAVSRDSTGFLKLGSPIQKVWRRPNHFALYAYRRQGLEQNKMRVTIKNKNGDIVFDREVEAPVTVQR